MPPNPKGSERPLGPPVRLPLLSLYTVRLEELLSQRSISECTVILGALQAGARRRRTRRTRRRGRRGSVRAGADGDSSGCLPRTTQSNQRRAWHRPNSPKKGTRQSPTQIRTAHGGTRRLDHLTHQESYGRD